MSSTTAHFSITGAALAAVSSADSARSAATMPLRLTDLRSADLRAAARFAEFDTAGAGADAEISQISAWSPVSAETAAYQTSRRVSRDDVYPPRISANTRRTLRTSHTSRSAGVPNMSVWLFASMPIGLTLLSAWVTQG